MERMDKKAKRRFGIICLIPNLAFLTVAGYYLYSLWPLIKFKDLENHFAISSITAAEYDTLFWMTAIAAVISAVVLIYCIVHVTKIKHMLAGTKIVWILILSALVPVSFLIFYFLEVRQEPKHLETYADIA